MKRVTAAIVVLGLLALVWGLASTERRRARETKRLEVGMGAAQVVQVMGEPPVTCPVGTLAHLRDRFPVGTPAVAAEQVVARLQRETAERWVYPLKRGGGAPAGCTPGEGSTEVGLDRNRRVLWYVPVTGRRPLEVPEAYYPSASGNT